MSDSISNLISARLGTADEPSNSNIIWQIDNILLDLLKKECSHCQSQCSLREFYLQNSQSLSLICQSCTNESSQSMRHFLEAYIAP